MEKTPAADEIFDRWETSVLAQEAGGEMQEDDLDGFERSFTEGERADRLRAKLKALRSDQQSAAEPEQ